MKRYRVKPGAKVNLTNFDAGATKGFKGSKKDAEELLRELTGKLEALQEALWAEHKHKVLIVLQGMDTSGKDGTIRHVFEGVNPLGVRVASFKAPTAEELEHDFLWRVHPKVPGRGEMVIFNRSHYEDVIAARVRRLVPPEVWRKRYSQINDFERLLAETGTVILKFFLHIDTDEQKERLQARLDDPAKRWKFRRGDLDDRALWPEYLAAYEEALSRTSQEHAPWYIVPANKKWYRNLVVASILVKTLEDLDLKVPEPEEDLAGVVIE
ncbi:MAG TPA: polyphosphate kinase 2 family protein [Thermoanaerobaculia bacterium]|jgi:PPK2 family polyphosphate:nucleotide phosphotransferase|nr:polyphosphate kinase 2 family protein [Thermoanaerobaculia bacterium]